MIATMPSVAWLLIAVLAQNGIDQDKSRARLDGPVTVSPSEAKVGDVVKLTLTVQVDPGWHIYSANEPETKSEFDFEGMPVKIDGKIEEPKPHSYKPKGLDETYQIHEGKVTFVVPLRITPEAKPGELTLKGSVGPQVCDDRSCMPWSDEFSVKLKILEGKSEPIQQPPAPTPAPAPAPASGGDLRSSGFLGFLIVCIGGGLVSLFMPCVYPLIPITLTYFVKQGAGNRAKSIALSTAYAAGIIISFTAIGMILSVLLGGDGARVFAADPWVNLIIALMFTVFAISLFGVFEIQLPSSWTNAVAGSPRSGILGAFILGLTFSVVTFTCTIPITAALLAMAATGAGGWALTGMIAYSVTMALPFFVLGFFPGALGKVPKSGGWLHNVKICAAFLEIALAVKYFANSDFAWGFDLLSRDFGIIVWIICMVFAALYLLDVYRFKEDAPLEHVSLPRLVIAAVFAGMAIYMFTGLGEKPLGFMDAMLPPFRHEVDSGTASKPEGGKDETEFWFRDYEQGLAEARKSHTPIFIDFTGFT